MYRIQKLTERNKKLLSYKLLNLIEGRNWVIASEHKKWYGLWSEEQGKQALKKNI